jgi:hypothetical protein
MKLLLRRNKSLKTAGPSTALRSGRDDNSVTEGVPSYEVIEFFKNRIVIPTGAQRSGGTCCFNLRFQRMLLLLIFRSFSGSQIPAVDNQLCSRNTRCTIARQVENGVRDLVRRQHSR